MKLQLLKVEQALHSYLCACGIVRLSVLIWEVSSYSDQFLTRELTAGHSAEKKTFVECSATSGPVRHLYSIPFPKAQRLSQNGAWEDCERLRRGGLKQNCVCWTKQDQCIMNSQQLWLPACDSAREYSSMKGSSQTHHWLSHHVWLLGEEKSVLFKDKVSGKPTTLWWLASHPEVTGQRKLGL